MTRRKEFKEEILRLLGGKCAYCGFEPVHPCQIDLHEKNGRLSKIAHIGALKKPYHPSILAGTVHGRKLLMDNLDQIVPLCRNCHIRLTCATCRMEVDKVVMNWRRPV